MTQAIFTASNKVVSLIILGSSLFLPLFSRQPMPSIPPWPSMRQIIGDNRFGKKQEHLKYALRMFQTRRYRTAFLQELAQHPEWLALYQRYPRNYQNLLIAFLDRRYNRPKHFQALAQDLKTSAQYFPPAMRQQLSAGEAVLLCEVQGQWSVQLLHNPINPQEGHWALVLRDEENRPVFYLSFGFPEPGQALIASVQGSQDLAGQAQLQRLQHLTKLCHGLRPPHLLLQLFMAFCHIIGISIIDGIAPENHIKGRWNQRHRLKFDYLGLWQESQALLQPSGHWRLLEQVPRKEMAEIASKKRSQYKKRYQMLDDCKEMMHQRWPALH